MLFSENEKAIIEKESIDIKKQSSINIWSNNLYELLALSSLFSQKKHIISFKDFDLISLTGLKSGDVYKLVIALTRVSDIKKINVALLSEELPPLLKKLVLSNGIKLINHCTPLQILKNNLFKAMRYVDSVPALNQYISDNNLLSYREFSTLAKFLQTGSMKDLFIDDYENHKTLYGHRFRALRKLGYSSPYALASHGRWLNDLILKDRPMAIEYLCKHVKSRKITNNMEQLKPKTYEEFCYELLNSFFTHQVII